MGICTLVAAPFAVFGVGSALGGCGGEDQASKPVQYPKSDGGLVTQGSAQVGVSTPGETSGLTGAAKDAYERGWRAWLNGDLNGAKAAFQEAGAAAPSSPAPPYSLGTVLERLGDSSGAQAQFKAAVSNKSDYEPAICAYALSLASNGKGSDADAFLSDKHAKLPNSYVVTTCYAEVKSLEKDSASAQSLAGDALRVKPDYAEAMVVIARDYYRNQKIGLAMYALQAILDGFGESSPPRDKDNAEAHLLRGIIERDQGQRLAAMTDFEAARTKRPDMVEALIQTGAMKLEAGNVAEATPLLEASVRYAPQNALAHLNLGDAYRLAGRPADAKKEFDKALSLDSTQATAHYDLGLMYLFSPSIPGLTADGQVATAIKEFETYKSMRGPKAPPGQADDTDELLARAKAKQAELKNAAAAAATPPAAAAPPAASGSAAPAAPASTGGKTVGGGKK
ncbi:MAG: tetratricopeptide repeat protein [Polyangiaceae bacterium]